MAKLFHVAIGYAGKAIGSEEIQKAFGNAGWARYAPNCWIVSTDEAPKTLTDQIRTIVGESDSIFVCELNTANNYGYLQKEIWDWFNERASRS